jgi:hypothetical protein
VQDASKLELVRDSALAVELTGDQCRVLTALMDVLDLADGEILVKSDASDNRVYAVVSGALDLQSYTLSLFLPNGTRGLLTGVISGTGAIRINENAAAVSELILGVNNTYSGPTTVFLFNRVQVSGTQSSSYDLRRGTLVGSGTLGSVSATDVATIAPGNTLRKLSSLGLATR